MAECVWLLDHVCHELHNKVVLDVGAGTGILSMMAARTGAKKVYAVECSDIAKTARSIVKENNLDGIIEVIQGKIEDIELPEKVDVIVSEWMGYFLLYESMLNSVLAARVKFGAPCVRLLPDKASMHIVAIEDAAYWARKTTFWEDRNGLNYYAVERLDMLEPLIENVPPEQLVTDVVEFISFDLNTCRVEDLSFRDVPPQHRDVPHT